MPSGYTSKLYDGQDQTFPEFAMDCARAFGALIELRDDANAPIPESFQPGTYHVERLKKARQRLAELRARTDDEWRVAQENEVSEQNDHTNKALRLAAERRARYERMLTAVKSWTPPTNEHINLRKFMQDQLEDSIRFDCSTSHLTYRSIRPVSDYKAAEIERAIADVERAKKNLAEEQERTEGRTEWLRALRASLEAAIL